MSISASPAMPDLRLAPNDRILIFAPHPDDETIATGGVIQQAVAMGLPIRLVYLTYGDNAETAFIAYRKRPVVRSKSVQGMGLTRHDEAVAAADVLGLSPDQLTFLGYPDFRTLKIWTDHWGTDAAPCESMFTRTSSVPYASAFRPGAPYRADEILADLKTIIGDFQPTVIFTAHPGDHNPDHLSLYLLTRVALWDLAGKLQPVLWPYLVHHPEWPEPVGYHPELALRPPDRLAHEINWHTLPVSLERAKVKHQAVQCHQTQLKFDRDYLDSFMRTNELFGDFAEVDLRPNRGGDNSVSAGEPVVSSKLRHSERVKFVGIMDRSIHIEGDRAVFAVTFSRPLAKITMASIYMFGYRPDVPFSEMPKLRLDISGVEHAVMDGGKWVRDSGIKVEHSLTKLAFSAPLAALGDPKWVLGSARTQMGAVPMDWIAWRVIRLQD